jgi:hypothetical protein
MTHCLACGYVGIADAADYFCLDRQDRARMRCPLGELSAPKALEVRSHTRMLAIAVVVEVKCRLIAIQEHLERGANGAQAVGRTYDESAVKYLFVSMP